MVNYLQVHWVLAQRVSEKVGKASCFNICVKLTLAYAAITTFEEARRSDIENERLPPASRESINAIHQETTNSKLRDAIGEQDDDLSRLAEVIASVPDHASGRKAKSQV